MLCWDFLFSGVCFCLFVCSEVVVLLGNFGTVSVEFFFRFNAVAKFRFFSEVLCCCWNCHEALALLGSLLLL